MKKKNRKQNNQMSAAAGSRKPKPQLKVLVSTPEEKKPYLMFVPSTRFFLGLLSFLPSPSPPSNFLPNEGKLVKL